MESEPEIRTIRTSVVTRSIKKLETIRLEVISGLKIAGIAMHFCCNDQHSAIEMCLSVNERSESFKQIARLSMGMTHENATRMIRRARQEQRHGGDNVGYDPELHTSLAVAPLVLAHLSPQVDFSFTNLHPHTINGLKVLALEHQSPFSSPRIA